MKILVTGSAGFIGFHLASQLIARGDQIVGYDNHNDYYDVRLKQARLEQLTAQVKHSPAPARYQHIQADLLDKQTLTSVFTDFRPDRVVHLAAQAGVLYSLENPQAYIDANIQGFMNMLECCRQYPVEHLVYASSSSVYGANSQMPFSEHQNVDHPVSLYAATKKSNELMAHTYSHLYQIPTTGLRFFTVYGPWGRPDMALFKFTHKILNNQPIDIYNHGHHQRDFTYIDDIVTGLIKTLDLVATPSFTAHSSATDLSTDQSTAPYRIYNIGNNQPVPLMRLIAVLETCLGKEAEKRLLPMQPGEVPTTYANIDALFKAVGYRPNTSIETGVQRFVDWYRHYYF